ncbi:uncharacterized protein LOC142246677 [Anomaloglossus baeobatrachus]|uniref:uncharacterized protein LOC142246677 n=1 Tax=Anomaloglossus baeobatrachus TaxID=238106 RepID=UPI003F4F51C7
MKAQDKSVTTRAQTAMDRDTKNFQMKKAKRRPTTTKPQSHKNTSSLVPSGKLELPQTHDGKVEAAKEVNNSNLGGSKMSNKKSNQSSRTAEGNTSLKTKTLTGNFGPGRRTQGNPSSKNTKVLVSSGKIKTTKKTSHQVPSMADKPSTIMKSEDSKAQPPIGEKSTDDAMLDNTSSDRDLAMQNIIQSPKYRRACSPASYVFFSLENKESSIIVEVDGCTKSCTQNNPTGGNSRLVRRLSSERASTRCPGGTKEYMSYHKGSSELALLQEILSDSGNNVTSGSFDSWPFSSCENSEESRVQHRSDYDVSEVHGDLADINDYNKLGSMLDCKATMTPGYSCSCGEHSSYETDSTLDEEYIFSDTSLDLSLSEDDDTNSSSKFDAFGKGQEERMDDVMVCPEYIQGSHI